MVNPKFRAALARISRPFRPVTKPLRTAIYRARGQRFARRDHPSPDGGKRQLDGVSNPLEAYFDAHTEGPGIWKWRHYFEVYHRHLAKFVGREVHVVEIGIYSGGSLSMWRDYFGAHCHIYGVDIEDACRAYESDSVTVFIGDQADPAFWREFCRKVPSVDIVIDDGGHHPSQQIPTFEALLPHMRSGGVYICEDIMNVPSGFEVYSSSLAANLNVADSTEPTPFHQMVHSIHRYPFVTVFEKPEAVLPAFSNPKQGTQWQPFFD